MDFDIDVHLDADYPSTAVLLQDWTVVRSIPRSALQTRHPYDYAFPAIPRSAGQSFSDCSDCIVPRQMLCAGPQTGTSTRMSRTTTLDLPKPLAIRRRAALPIVYRSRRLLALMSARQLWSSPLAVKREKCSEALAVVRRTRWALRWCGSRRYRGRPAGRIRTALPVFFTRTILRGSFILAGIRGSDGRRGCRCRQRQRLVPRRRRNGHSHTYFIGAHTSSHTWTISGKCAHPPHGSRLRTLLVWREVSGV